MSSQNSQAPRDKWIVYLLATALSALAGGGSGFMVDSQQQASLRHEVSKLSEAKSLLELRVQNLETFGNKQSQQLVTIEGKIEKGNEYIRDEVVKILSQMQADIAVLKARRG